MAQRNADRHARLKAIQEAQEAQRREDEAARAAVAGPAQASSSASVANHAAPQAAVPSSKGPDSDDYLLNSDDDAYFANLDLSALDEGVGRPIDFEEGTSGVDMDDDSMAASEFRPSAVVAPHNSTTSSGQHASVKAHPAPQQQQRTHIVSGSSAGGTSHQNQNVPPSTSSARPGGLASGERARTPSMGGGFSFPSGVRLLSSVVDVPYEIHMDDAAREWKLCSSTVLRNITGKRTDAIARCEPRPKLELELDFERERSQA